MAHQGSFFPTINVEVGLDLWFQTGVSLMNFHEGSKRYLLGGLPSPLIWESSCFCCSPLLYPPQIQNPGSTHQSLPVRTVDDPVSQRMYKGADKAGPQKETELKKMCREKQKENCLDFLVPSFLSDFPSVCLNQLVVIVPL